MSDLMLTLNQPLVLWSLLGGSIGLILVDYLFPVDWPAFGGYALFAVFIGATIPAPSVVSLSIMAVVLATMLLLHHFVFAKFLTNAPRYERVADAPTEANR